MTESRAGERFALILREEIRVSGYTLETLQRHLAERGVRVGRSTLSYWQNGERLPTGPSSLAVVRELESVLGVAAGTLLEAVSHRSPTRTVDDFDVVVTGRRIEELMDEVGCTGMYAAAEVVAYQDFGELGADGSLQHVLSVLTLRAAEDFDRYPAVYGGEQGGDPRLVKTVAVSGARVGRVRRDDAANVVVSEMVFDRVVPRGEFHVLRWITYDGNVTPTLNAYLFGGSVRTMVSLEMHFHQDCLPVVIEEFEQSQDTGPDRFRRPIVLGADRRVTLVRERQKRGIIGLRWRYA